MDVSMDGLRWRLITSYNSLTKKLNSATVDKSWSPEIKISPDEIQNEMDNLRGLIATLAYCSLEGEFSELENPHFEDFNPE